MEAAGQIVCPLGLPETKNIWPLELPLIPHQQHAEKEEKVGAVGRLEVQIQLRIHQLYQMVKRQQLRTHSGLIPKEVVFLYRHIRNFSLKELGFNAPFGP